MIPSLDPKQMEKLMRQMGINSKDIGARRVVIECEGQNVIVNEPKVVEINAQGQKSYQIFGKTHVETAISGEDVEMVISQTGAKKEEAIEALRKTNGNIAEAILLLKSQ